MKVISGGQIGVDIAALRAGVATGIATGGWMPKGFRQLRHRDPWCTYTEQMSTGDIKQFKVMEIGDSGYVERTRRNVSEADLTIRIASDWTSYGEKCTLKAIQDFKKPHIDITVDWKGQLLGGVDEFELIEKLSDHLAGSKLQVSSSVNRSSVNTTREIVVVSDGIDILNVAGNAKESLEQPIQYFLELVFARWRAKKRYVVYHEGSDCVVVVKEDEYERMLNTESIDLMSFAEYSRWREKQ